MAITKKGIVDSIKKIATKASKPIEAVMMVPSKISTASKRKKDVWKLQDKFYPSYTVTGEATHKKRNKEFKKMYEKSGPVPVVKKAKQLKDEFNYLNR